MPFLTNRGSSGLFLAQDSLRRWKAALAASGSSLVRLAHLGDSMSQPGFGNCTQADCWPVKLITALQALYGDGGSGFLSVVNSPAGQFSSGQAPGQYIVQSGTTNTWSQQVGIAGIPNGIKVTTTGAISANSHIMTWPNTVVRGRFIEIYWGQSAGGTDSFNYSIDGGGNVLVTPTTGAGYGYTIVDTGVVGAHSVALKTAAANTGFQPIGVLGRNSTGVMLNNMALWGRSMASITSPDARAVSLTPDAVNFPQLALIMLGVNDSTSAETGSAFMLNTQAIADITIAQKVDAFWCIEDAGVADTTSGGNYSTFASIIGQVANMMGDSVLDLWTLDGRNPNTLLSSGYTTNIAGDIHPNALFCDIIGRQILASVLGSLAPF